MALSTYVINSISNPTEKSVAILLPLLLNAATREPSTWSWWTSTLMFIRVSTSLLNTVNSWRMLLSKKIPLILIPKNIFPMLGKKHSVSLSSLTALIAVLPLSSISGIVSSLIKRSSEREDLILRLLMQIMPKKLKPPKNQKITLRLQIPNLMMNQSFPKLKRKKIRKMELNKNSVMPLTYLVLPLLPWWMAEATIP